jgi:acetyl-CoA carboxylase carboxyl transferase subunit alpha
MKTAYEIVKMTRSKDRQTAWILSTNIFSGLCGAARRPPFCRRPSVVAGLATLAHIPFTVIATEKGRELKKPDAPQFWHGQPRGLPQGDATDETGRKFSRPVVCFVDTCGAFPGIGAEERGQGQAIAQSITDMMALKTPILSILIGEGGSGGALALAVANEVWMLENAIYSVIAPESCANILWRDPDKAAEAAENLKLTAQDVYALGVVERIISEKGGDAERLFMSLKSDILVGIRK